jgi:hypothetical protein
VSLGKYFSIDSKMDMAERPVALRHHAFEGLARFKLFEGVIALIYQ